MSERYSGERMDLNQETIPEEFKDLIELYKALSRLQHIPENVLHRLVLPERDKADKKRGPKKGDSKKNGLKITENLIVSEFNFLLQSKDVQDKLKTIVGGKKDITQIDHIDRVIKNFLEQPHQLFEQKVEEIEQEDPGKKRVKKEVYKDAAWEVTGIAAPSFQDRTSDLSDWDNEKIQNHGKRSHVWDETIQKLSFLPGPHQEVLERYLQQRNAESALHLIQVYDSLNNKKKEKIKVSNRFKNLEIEYSDDEVQKFQSDIQFAENILKSIHNKRQEKERLLEKIEAEGKERIAKIIREENERIQKESDLASIERKRDQEAQRIRAEKEKEKNEEIKRKVERYSTFLKNIFIDLENFHNVTYHKKEEIKGKANAELRKSTRIRIALQDTVYKNNQIRFSIFTPFHTIYDYDVNRELKIIKSWKTKKDLEEIQSSLISVQKTFFSEELEKELIQEIEETEAVYDLNLRSKYEEVKAQAERELDDIVDSLENARDKLKVEAQLRSLREGKEDEYRRYVVSQKYKYQSPKEEKFVPETLSENVEERVRKIKELLASFNLNLTEKQKIYTVLETQQQEKRINILHSLSILRSIIYKNSLIKFGILKKTQTIFDFDPVNRTEILVEGQTKEQLMQLQNKLKIEGDSLLTQKEYKNGKNELKQVQREIESDFGTLKVRVFQELSNVSESVRPGTESWVREELSLIEKKIPFNLPSTYGIS